MEDKTTHDHSARGMAEALNYLLDMLADETTRRLRPEGRSEVDSKPQTTSSTADKERDAGDDICGGIGNGIPNRPSESHATQRR